MSKGAPGRASRPDAGRLLRTEGTPATSRIPKARGPLALAGSVNRRFLPFAKALSHASNGTAFLLHIFLLKLSWSSGQRLFCPAASTTPQSAKLTAQFAIAPFAGPEGPSLRIRKGRENPSRPFVWLMQGISPVSPPPAAPSSPGHPGWP